MTMIESVKQYAGVDFDEITTDEAAQAIAKEKGLEVEAAKSSRGHIIALFFDEFVEDKLCTADVYYGIRLRFRRWQKRKAVRPVADGAVRGIYYGARIRQRIFRIKRPD